MLTNFSLLSTIDPAGFLFVSNADAGSLFPMTKDVESFFENLDSEIHNYYQAGVNDRAHQLNVDPPVLHSFQTLFENLQSEMKEERDHLKLKLESLQAQYKASSSDVEKKKLKQEMDTARERLERDISALTGCGWRNLQLYVKTGFSLTPVHDEFLRAAACNFMLPASRGDTLFV